MIVDDTARWSVVKQKCVLQLQCIINYCIYSFIARIEKLDIQIFYGVGLIQKYPFIWQHMKNLSTLYKGCL